MLRKIKSWILPVHRWTGLTVGLVVALMAATGASMAFRPQIEPLLSSKVLSVPVCQTSASIDDLTKQAVAQNPGGRLDFIRITPSPQNARRTTATWIRFTDKKTYYFDPCTGRMLGQIARYGGAFGTIEKIHRFRWTSIGSKITGITASLLIIVMIFGGLVLWLPLHRKALSAQIRLNTRLKGRPGLLNLHRVTGIYAAVFLLMSALTGLPQAFPPAKDFIYSVTGSPLPAKAPTSSVHQEGAERLSFDTFLAAGMELAQSPREIQLRYPMTDDSSIAGFYVAPKAPHINARSLFYLDAYDGSVLVHKPHAQNSMGHKLYFWTLSWHQGLVFGLFSQILIFFGAISALVLAYTGILSFLIKKFPIMPRRTTAG
jgi:uncharacterized iron-regulated membrane protein